MSRSDVVLPVARAPEDAKAQEDSPAAFPLITAARIEASRSLRLIVSISDDGSGNSEPRSH